MSHGPIEEKQRAAMNIAARALGEMFKGYGFALLVFEFGDSGRMNYVSNARREDMIAAMKEFIANAEGRMVESPEGKQ